MVLENLIGNFIFDRVKKKRPVRSYILRQGRLTKYQENGIKRFSSKYTIPFQKSLINFDQVFSKKNKIILNLSFEIHHHRIDGK